MKRKVLVANRGEIACRIIRTLRHIGMGSVAVYTDVDTNAPHVWLADEAVSLGGPAAYLDADRIIDAALRSGCGSVHPGYGFLSQNAGFVRVCDAAGVGFIGPSASSMEALGDKRSAREVAVACKVPVVPGATACDSVQEAQVAAQRVGYPVLLKAAGGGGGKGMRRVAAPDAMAEAFAAAGREAKNAFSDDRLLVEKYIDPARHVEVQILGDGHRVMALGDRECSLQRRYQKIIEEAPCAVLDDATRSALHDAAVRIGTAVSYSGAATVEFLLGPGNTFYFLEVNTRLQVEHPVTELLLGLDIVAAQVEIAYGRNLPKVESPRGHAIEARLNAENPSLGFLPSVGTVSMLHWPHIPNVRIDSGIVEGSTITPHYDSLLGKVIAFGPTREQARLRLLQALRETVCLGLHTNQAFLLDVLQRSFFIKGDTYTTTIESEHFAAPALPDWAHKASQMADAPEPEDLRSGDGDVYTPWRSLTSFRMGA